METLQYNQEPFLPPHEEEDLEFNALLGAIEDLSLEFESSTDTRRQDEEIMSALQSVYQAGAEYANNDLVRTMAVFNEFEARLGAMQSMCNHDHMMSEAFGVNESDASGKRHSKDDGHDHGLDEDDDEYEIDPVTGKRRKKKKKQ